MVTRKIKPEIKKKGIFSILILALIAFIIASCQQSSEDSSVSASTDRTAPTTTVSVGGTCVLTVLTVTGCTADPIDVTFNVNESATVYYAQGTSSGVSVSTNSSSVSAGGTVNITGTEGTIVYVAFFAQDTAGNSESSRELIVNIPDLTAPVSSITLSGGSTCIQNPDAFNYLCDGPINVDVSADDNTAVTLYWDVTTDTASTGPFGSSGIAPQSISVDANDSYLSYTAIDTAGNQEATVDYYFEINGVTPTINGGYYNSTQTFKFQLSSNRTVPNGYYQLHYLLKSGTDASADTTSDADSVYATGPPVTINSNSTRYLNLYPSNTDDTSEDVNAAVSSGETLIYQYKYNIIYDGTQDASDDVVGGSKDKENTLVLYIDNDSPKAIAIPPSSGSLSSPIEVSTHFQDNGHDLIEQYAALNPFLSAATPLQSPTSGYCSSTSSFSTDCDATTDYVTLASLSLTADTQVGLKGTDAAGNAVNCPGAAFEQYNCDNSSFTFNVFSEEYTPGMQQSSYYHRNQTVVFTDFFNFGYSVAVGDLDGDGSSDIAIGAPAYSHSGGVANLENGAVYIWYNGFRERAILSLIDNSATVNVTGRYMEFDTDDITTASLRIYLDPSTDTSSYGSDKFQAESTDYTDKTVASASEIASVLNDAFLNSYGKSFQNYLYADASTDGKLSIGHVNRTIKGYFTYTSNFDSTSDMYYSGNTIRAYDYVIYGETAGDEFGYSVAIGQVDTSVDTAQYSASQLVVGAPGFGAVNDDGAVYVVRMPKSDASADYGQVTLFDSTDDAYKIHATTGDGRLGHALKLYDSSNDGYSEIYVSAPYYDLYYTNAGGIYRIDQQDYSYSNATSDVTAVSSGSYFWRGPDLLGTNATNALFGFSLEAGNTKYSSANSWSQFLYVGIPGASSSGLSGKVGFFDLNSASPLAITYPSFYEQADTPANEYFGYSLAIVNNEFDTSTTSKCPCLIVGAPGASAEKGEVFVLGGDSYQKNFTGAAATDFLGVKLLVGKIGSSETFDTIFMAARSANNKGHIVIARQQELRSDTELTSVVNSDLAGTTNGDNLGLGMAIISIGGAKALITGMPGEQSGSYDRISNVRVYSGNNRLGY